MTNEERDYLLLPEVQEHMSLVIESAQDFPRSHDIASRVIAIIESTEGPLEHCGPCVQSAYQTLRNKLNEEQKTNRKAASKPAK